MAEHGFALVGLGAISTLWIDAIAKVRSAKLRVVCDIDANRAREVAQEHGCHYVTDHRAIATCPDVDVVAVTTWSGLHAPIGVDCARGGKHIITTKPIDVRLEAIDDLIRTCDENGVRLAALHQSRSLPAYRDAKRAIEEGRLGRLYMGNAYCKWFRPQAYYDSAAWRGTYDLDGGGCLMNQGIHYIDALIWFMGDVAAVSGWADTLARDIEVEDCAVASLRFTSGALGTIQGGTCIYGGHPARVEVHGERGNIAIEGDEIVLWEVEGEETIRRLSTAEAGAGDPVLGFAHALDAHVEQIGDLLHAIEEGRDPRLNGREARRAVELILAIYRSGRIGQVVPLPLTGYSDPRGC